MDSEGETIIDLSNYSISEACYWLLQSLNSNDFMHLAYTIPYCSYVMSWHRAVPIQTILILQSPYPNDIFPPIAAAMSFDTELCKKKMQGRDMPPTIQVLINDLYINGGMEKEDSLAILKNGWALVDKGILMINEAVFYTYDRQQSYIEAAKQCAVLIRLLQETEKHGKRTINVFAFGEVGEKVGSNLCSWYKSSKLTLTKRKVTHPAGVARRFTDLNDPGCHMGTPSFSKSLVKCLRNHVAFMHTMAKKSEQDIKYQRQQDVLRGIYNHFPLVADSFQTVFDINRKAMEMSQTSQEHKDIMKKLEVNVDELITRLRITSSLTNNLQAYSGSISGNVSKSAPSMKSQPPSGSALSQHAGQEPTRMPLITSTSNLNIKPIKPKRVSTQAGTSSFSEITSPPSVTSISTETSKPKITPVKPRKVTAVSTPAKKSTTIETPTQPEYSQPTPNSYKEAKPDSEELDKLSPLAKKFSKTMRVPQVKANNKSVAKPAAGPSVNHALTTGQIHTLSCVQQVIEARKDVIDDDDIEYFESINNDVQHKTKYNSVVERLVKAIDKDIENIPDFNFIDWALDDSNPSATYDECRETFQF